MLNLLHHLKKNLKYSCKILLYVWIYTRVRTSFFSYEKIKNPHLSRITDNHLHRESRAATSNFDVEIERKKNEQYPTAKIAFSIHTDAIYIFSYF